MHDKNDEDLSKAILVSYFFSDLRLHTQFLTLGQFSCEVAIALQMAENPFHILKNSVTYIWNQILKCYHFDYIRFLENRIELYW